MPEKQNPGIRNGYIMIVFADKDLLLIEKDGTYRFPSIADCGLPPVSEVFHIDGEEAYSVLPPLEPLPSGLVRMPLRESYLHLPYPDYSRATKAAELINFDRGNLYCPKCGTLLRRASEISKQCPSCGNEIFPQLSPAILVLVTRGEKALLVHARNFSRPMFALVAGFVETGESLEECVEREVMEETGLKVKNIRYFGSQSWPFPSQLMVGFTAEWESGEIVFADHELTDGGWFSRDNAPLLPTPPSLSRRIIDSWLLLKS